MKQPWHALAVLVCAPVMSCGGAIADDAGSTDALGADAGDPDVAFTLEADEGAPQTDCNPCVSGHCGDGVCDCGETPTSCPVDCRACPDSFEFIPSGEFDMGSPPGEPGRHIVENLHHVVISRGFCLKRTEVTQDEWQSAMGNSPSYNESCGGACPVERVSWWDSIAYCNTLSEAEGLTPCYVLVDCKGTPGTGFLEDETQTFGGFYCKGAAFAGLTCNGYRLPTEAEWEYAARAGTTTSTYNGTMDSDYPGCATPDPVLDPIAWFCGNSLALYDGAWFSCYGVSPCGPQPVGTKQPNAWGLHDMLGNVWEWVWDWSAPYPGGTVIDPTGPESGGYRMFRGGSWAFQSEEARAAVRWYNSLGYHSGDLGFRPVLSASTSSTLSIKCPGN
jgi:formylglycine-generating enzyme required for sulfatase activity